MHKFLHPVTHPQVIAASWARSKNKHQLLASTSADPSFISAGQMAARLDKYQNLLHHLKKLSEILWLKPTANQARLLFASAKGEILFSHGSKSFGSQAEQLALKPGAIWQEENMGTNAIGTALVEQSEVSVLGSEHFLTSNQQISCSASPVFSPQGELLGVIDISSDAASHSSSLLFTAQLLAQTLENTLISEQEEASWTLSLAANSSCINLPWAGLITLTEDGKLLGANRLAKPWLEKLNLADLFASLRQGELTPFGKGVALLSKKLTHKLTKNFKPAKAKPAEQPAANQAYSQALKLLNAGLPLFISGETGVGKDYLVKKLHRLSNFADQPLIAVNCGALPAELLEAELFGYKAGAFTGSNKQGSLGYVRAADKGILFLDEIAELPLAAQTRLLRVLQEKAVTPLGSSISQEVDFRVIAASHKNLQEMVEAGSFRKDLFFRLNAYEVQLPALRNFASADLEQLINNLLHKLRPEENFYLSPAALNQLLNYSWPGNIRQLENCLEVALVLADNQLIDVEHLPALPELATPWQSEAEASPTNNKDIKANLTDKLHQQILTTLETCKGNVSATAKKLGISRTTIYKYMRA